jgi:hypothetical protein
VLSNPLCTLLLGFAAGQKLPSIDPKQMDLDALTTEALRRLTSLCAQSKVRWDALYLSIKHQLHKRHTQPATRPPRAFVFWNPRQPSGAKQAVAAGAAAGEGSDLGRRRLQALMDAAGDFVELRVAPACSNVGAGLQTLSSQAHMATSSAISSASSCLVACWAVVCEQGGGRLQGCVVLVQESLLPKMQLAMGEAAEAFGAEMAKAKKHTALGVSACKQHMTQVSLVCSSLWRNVSTVCGPLLANTCDALCHAADVCSREVSAHVHATALATRQRWEQAYIMHLDPLLQRLTAIAAAGVNRTAGEALSASAVVSEWAVDWSRAASGLAQV